MIVLGSDLYKLVDAPTAKNLVLLNNNYHLREINYFVNIQNHPKLIINILFVCIFVARKKN